MAAGLPMDRDCDCNFVTSDSVRIPFEFRSDSVQIPFGFFHLKKLHLKLHLKLQSKNTFFMASKGVPGCCVRSAGSTTSKESTGSVAAGANSADTWESVRLCIHVVHNRPCVEPSCTFAHTVSELHEKYKTAPCDNWVRDGGGIVGSAFGMRKFCHTNFRLCAQRVATASGVNTFTASTTSTPALCVFCANTRSSTRSSTSTSTAAS